MSFHDIPDWYLILYGMTSIGVWELWKRFTRRWRDNRRAKYTWKCPYCGPDRGFMMRSNNESAVVEAKMDHIDEFHTPH